MKKILSTVLAAVLILTALLPSASALFENGCDCGYTPIIYIKGRTMIYKDVDDLSKGKAEKETSGGDEAIKDAAVNISKAFAKAVATDKWDNYCDVLYEEIMPLYDQYALNDDGEIDNKSGIDPNWNIENILKRVYEGGKNRHIEAKDDVFAYEFQYDIRIEPEANAANLRKLVEAVKEVSGHDKVSIIGRCEGGVIENAYFNIYGWDDIEDVIVYNSIAAGSEVADAAFSGKFTVDAESLNRFLNEFSGTSSLIDLGLAVAQIMNYNGVLAHFTGFVQTIYDKVAPNLMPRLIRDIFGKCPGWYSMISPDRFEECKSFVLGDNADGKYDKLIAKIDNYNYNYKVNAKNVLEQMEKDGVDVHIIVKYNNQMYPVVENNDMLGDGVVSVSHQTMGATTAGIMKTLSDEYLQNADSAFISPDKMIDASTGILPTHTWYVRDLPHDNYPNEFNPFMLKLIRYDGYADIYTFEDMPQWMIFSKSDGNTFKPLTSDGPSATDNRPEKSFFKILFNFIKKIIAFLADKIKIKSRPPLKEVA